MSRRDVNIYFINYKNSVRGTGGVGTVSRDMVRYHPDIHFIFWDGSVPDRENDFGIKIPREIHETVHIQYAKAYLWPVLHSLPSHISSSQLFTTRQKMIQQAKLIAEKTYKFVHDHSEQSLGNIYWINDYTSISLIGALRKMDKNSTIIYTFRTPFGAKNKLPEFHLEDIALLEKLLLADCVTFHRRNDLEQFINFVQEKFPNAIAKIIINKNEASLVLNNNEKIKLIAIPIGNNKKYRQGLLQEKQSKDFYKYIKINHKDCVLIAGISRFEESKGIEYEIDLIDTLLSIHPEMIGKFVFLRFSYLSTNKKKSLTYSGFRNKLVSKIERINAKYGNDEWQPIVYDLNKKLNDREVAGLLMATDILIIASWADGFNHLAIEAIHSQKRFGSIQLLLSDIGATDYIRGYIKLSHDTANDAKILYESIKSGQLKNWINQQRLYLSANKLSSERWTSQIIKIANSIRKAKYDQSCHHHTSK